MSKKIATGDEGQSQQNSQGPSIDYERLSKSIYDMMEDRLMESVSDRISTLVEDRISESQSSSRQGLGPERGSAQQSGSGVRQGDRSRPGPETDNKAVAWAGMSWSLRLDHLAKLFRILARIAIRHNFEAKFSHIPGKGNVDAEDLSRGRLEEFRRRNPGADEMESTHSQSLLNACLSKL